MELQLKIAAYAQLLSKLHLYGANETTTKYIYLQRQAILREIDLLLLEALKVQQGGRDDVNLHCTFEGFLHQFTDWDVELEPLAFLLDQNVITAQNSTRLQSQSPLQRDCESVAKLDVTRMFETIRAQQEKQTSIVLAGMMGAQSVPLEESQAQPSEEGKKTVEALVKKMKERMANQEDDDVPPGGVYCHSNE